MSSQNELSLTGKTVTIYLDNGMSITGLIQAVISDRIFIVTEQKTFMIFQSKISVVEMENTEATTDSNQAFEEKEVQAKVSVLKVKNPKQEQMFMGVKLPSDADEVEANDSFGYNQFGSILPGDMLESEGDNSYPVDFSSSFSSLPGFGSVLKRKDDTKK